MHVYCLCEGTNHTSTGSNVSVNMHVFTQNVSTGWQQWHHEEDLHKDLITYYQITDVIMTNKYKYYTATTTKVTHPHLTERQAVSVL